MGSVTVDLVQWIREQLGIDAARAMGAAEEDGPSWRYDGRVVVTRRDGDLVAVGSQDFMELERGKHIAAHDPARGLREVEAKREIVARYVAAAQATEDLKALRERLQAQRRDVLMTDLDLESAVHKRDELREVVRLLALPYADRDGYQEAWRP